MIAGKGSNGITVAVAGSGFWGKNLVRNFAQLGALHTICDTEPETLAGFGASYPEVRLTARLADILDDPQVDAVVLATPAETHHKLARLALLSGKDVFVEKPMALHAEEAEELVSLAVELDRVLMVGHLLHYHPAVAKIRELVASGALGELYYMSSHRLNLGRVRREENVLWSFAPHDASVMIDLAGMPEQVVATGGNYLQPGISDTTISSLAFPGGVRGHIYVSWLHPFKEHRLVVIGSRRMLVFNDLESEEKIRLYDKGVESKSSLAIRSNGYEVITFEPAEPLAVECSHFLECVATRSRPATDGESGVRVLQVLEAAQESLNGGGMPVVVRHPAGTI